MLVYNHSSSIKTRLSCFCVDTNSDLVHCGYFVETRFFFLVCACSAVSQLTIACGKVGGRSHLRGFSVVPCSWWFQTCASPFTYSHNILMLYAAVMDAGGLGTP